MSSANVVAFFCEDIREERSGLMSIIGIMPDNLNVEISHDFPQDQQPTIPRLTCYARLVFDPTKSDPRPVLATLIFPDDTERVVKMFDEAIVDKGIADAKELGSPLVGLISRVQMDRFPIIKPGRLRLRIKLGKDEFLAGQLNIIVNKQPKP